MIVTYEAVRTVSQPDKPVAGDAAFMLVSYTEMDIPAYEFYRCEFTVEECGDAESGPQARLGTTPWENIGIGVGCTSIDDLIGQYKAEKDMTPFIRDVIEELERYDQLSREAIRTVMQELPDMEARGFTHQDALRYCRCFEEVNPALGEDTALARMKAIDAKYPPSKRHPHI